jgi:cytochrome c oxidase assembly factor CtaG
MGFLNMHLGEAIAVSAFTLPIMLVLVVLISRNILNRE